ncbi:MAG: acyltransferase family protein [Leptolyngbya sp. SIO1E4]|nr:acyltransferase family protein [Leptolyngbya sp. SIO1E4]
MKKSAKDRIFSLDLLKAFSILAVVFFHGIFIPETAYEKSKYWVDVAFAPLRFCVPVLFTISFFLLRMSFDKTKESNIFSVAGSRIFRLLVPTLFWFSIAGLFRRLGDAPILAPMAQGKVFPGAYYLLVMIILIPIFSWLISYRLTNKRLLFIITAQFAVFGFIYISILYKPDFFLIHGLKIMSRPLPIYWFAYMAMGIFFYEQSSWLIKFSHKIPVWIKGASIVATATLMLLEYGYLRSIIGDHPNPFEYAMFSCILSVFVLFLCFFSINPDDLPPHIVSLVKTLSTYSLGIFCINGILSLIFLKLGILLLQGNQVSLLAAIILRIVGGIVLVTVALWLSKVLERVGLKACVR